MVTVREFVAKLSILDNLTGPHRRIMQYLDSTTGDRIVKIKGDTSDLSSKIANSGAAIREHIGGGAKSAEGAIKGVGKATEDITTGAKKAEGGIGNITKAATNLHSSIMKIAGSLAGIAAGGAIAGFTYLDAAKADLYTKEIYKAIDANKTLGFSSETLKKKASSMVAEAPGWKTTGQATQELYGMMSVARKYLGGGERGLGNAENISKAFFANQELMQSVGFENANDLVKAASKGTLRDEQKKALQGIGLSSADLTSPNKIFKKLEGMGGKVNIQAELDDRPWIKAQTNIASLRKTIGESIGGPMKTVTGILADFIGMITKIPGGSALIGYLAIFISLASILSLIVSAGAPLIGLISAIASATKIWAAAQWILNVAMEANPLGMIILALVALGGILYLVELKTHIFSNALKYLSETPMGQGVMKWFESIEKWIGKLKGGDILKILGAVALGPAGIMGAILGGGAGGPDKLGENIFKYLYYLYNLARTHFPWLDKAGELLTKIKGIFEWFYSLLQGLWSWLKNAIPGAAKAQAGTTLQKSLDQFSGTKNVLTYEGNGKYKWNKNGGYSEYSTEEMKNLVEAGKTGQGGVALDKFRWQKISAQSNKFDSLPGFAEGIADAVKRGLVGLSIKGLDELTKAINDLIAPLQNLESTIREKMGLGNSSPNTGLGGIGKSGEKTAYDPNNAQVQYFYNKGSTQEWEMKDWSQYSEVKNPAHRVPITEKDVPSSVVADIQKSPKGSTIRRPGLVHVSMPGEEVVSAARVEHGPGAVARALDLLNNISAGKPMAAGAGANYYITIAPHQDFSGMKVSSNVDVEKLMRQVRKETATIAVKSVKDALGQRRT